MIANILSVYTMATVADIQAGVTWYPHASQVGHEIAGERGAGVIAALSPQKAWEGNVWAARALPIMRDSLKGVTAANRTKALRILDGEPWQDVLGGRKVRNFAECIETQGDTDAVCLDRHALAIYQARVPTDKELAKLFASEAFYKEVADVYRLAAREVNLTPAQLQAITWTTWRRVKAGRRGYILQYSLFDGS